LGSPYDAQRLSSPAAGGGPVQRWVGWLVGMELRCLCQQANHTSTLSHLGEAISIADLADAHCFATPDFLKDREPGAEVRFGVFML